MPVVATTGAFGYSSWTLAVNVQRQVRSLRGYVVDTPVAAQMQIPRVPFPEILQLQYIDKVVVCAGPVVRGQCGSRSHSCSSFLLGPGR